MKKYNIVLLFVFLLVLTGCFNKTTPTSSLRLLSDKDISTIYPGEMFTVTIEN
jgi:hypothetical protein